MALIDASPSAPAVTTPWAFTVATPALSDAQVALEAGDLLRADERAYGAMLTAARALVREDSGHTPISDDAAVEEFRARFYDTKRFYDRFAQGKFARPLFHRHADGPETDPERARELIEETSLFIDAAHAMIIREAEERQQRIAELVGGGAQ